MKKILLILLFSPLIILAQEFDKLKVYLDCSWRCDDDFLQREMSYIDFYKDSKTSNLHIIVNGERSSNGGELVTFRFIGMNEFEGVDNTLTVSILPNTSDDLEIEDLDDSFYVMISNIFILEYIEIVFKNGIGTSYDYSLEYSFIY